MNKKLNFKKKMILKRLSPVNRKKILSRCYNNGEYSECYVDDLTGIIWVKDNIAYDKGTDNPVYGSIKSARCTILQSDKYHTLDKLINHYEKTVYSKKFTYVNFKEAKDEIELLTFNKKEFIEVLKRFSRLDKSSTKKGLKSKIRLTLSKTNINIIKYEMFPEKF